MFPDAPAPRVPKRRPEPTVHVAPEALSSFGLGEPPFDASPDPRFFFETQSQEDTYRKVAEALRAPHSLVTVIGGEGVGKSTFCGEIARRLPAQMKTVFVDAVSKDDLLDQLLQQVTEGREPPVPAGTDSEETRRQMFLSLQRHLAATYNTTHVVVVADDAERLDADALEWLVVLSNLAVGSTKLLRVVLVGTPELDVKLKKERLAELAPNGALRCRLSPLKPSELAPYIEHRLRLARGNAAAGRDGSALFSDAAIRALYSATRGVPGDVNRVATRALALASERQLARIEVGVLREAAGRLRRPSIAQRLSGLSTVAGIVTVAVLTYGGIVWMWGSGPAPSPSVEPARSASDAAAPPNVPAPASAQLPVPETSGSQPPTGEQDVVTEAPPALATAPAAQAASTPPPVPAPPPPPAISTAKPTTAGPTATPATVAVPAPKAMPVPSTIEAPPATSIAPTPAATSTGATSTVPPPPTGMTNLILAGSFRNAKNADDITAALVAKGLPAWVRRDTDRGWHFVYIGPFATRDDARAALPRVQTEFGLKDAVVRAGGPPASPPGSPPQAAPGASPPPLPDVTPAVPPAQPEAPAANERTP